MHSKVHSTQLWSDFLMQETARQYHRRSRRISIGQPVRLVPFIPRGELFEEIGTTRNVSREGLYFLTKREHYQEGMRLLVHSPITFPGNAATTPTSPKLFASNCSTMASVVLLSSSCRRSEALSEITDSRSMFLRSKQGVFYDGCKDPLVPCLVSMCQLWKE